jgi:hypothetical protein
VGFGLSVPRSILTLNALLGLGHGAASGVRGDLRRSRFLVYVRNEQRSARRFPRGSIAGAGRPSSLESVTKPLTSTSAEPAAEPAG